MSANSASGPGCARVRARLEVLIDGGLVALEDARDHGHLEACAPCREEQERCRMLLATIRVANAHDLEADLARVESVLRTQLPIRSSLQRARRGFQRRHLSRALLGAAAAAVALLALALGGRDLVPARSFAQGLSFTQILARLPNWSDVTRGLDELSRSFS